MARTKNDQALRAGASLAACLLLPYVFFLISPRWLERRPSLCLSQLIFKRSCPGCGMTRALSCSLHAQFRRAWHYNPRIVIVLPLLIVVWIQRITVSRRELCRALQH